jgi:ubiquinone/menaquinone biosynthesis C-methylase UbiE
MATHGTIATVNWDDAARQNRRAWEEVAEARAKGYRESATPASFFAAGGSILDPRVVDAVGDIRGLRLLHLMCSTGEETLSWAVLGAIVVGVDFSATSIALANGKADEAGIPAEFVDADVGHLPSGLLSGGFDLVYTATGVMVWIPDLDRWASAIARALSPGGRLVLWEEHPVATALWGVDGQVQVVADYFRRGDPIIGSGWGHFEGGEDATEAKYEFIWPLGDVINALVGHGLAIERLDEYPTEAEWRFGSTMDQARRLPGRMLLTARRQ